MARDCPLPYTLCLSVFTGVSPFVQFDQPNRCQVYSDATCHVGARATMLNTHDAVLECRVSGRECDVGTCLHTKYSACASVGVLSVILSNVDLCRN